MSFKEFENRFKALTEEEQDFLKIMSIAYEPLSQSAIIKLMINCGIYSQKGKRFDTKTSKVYLNKLTKNGFLEKPYRGEWQCKHPDVEFIMRLASEDADFKLYISCLLYTSPSPRDS